MADESELPEWEVVSGPMAGERVRAPGKIDARCLFREAYRARFGAKVMPKAVRIALVPKGAKGAEG